MTFSWTQPICDDCFGQQNPNRIPHRVKYPTKEVCAYCGFIADTGIFVRDDPKNVAYPRKRSGA